MTQTSDDYRSWGMMIKPRFAVGKAEVEAIHECLEYYEASGLDPGYQAEFERRYTEAFCKYHGGGYADAVATGTAAVFVALAALRLPKGSEVLVSPITDPGTISAIILNNLVPRLMDSAPGSFNIDRESFYRAMDKNVEAAVIVHSLGRAVHEIVEVVKVATGNDIRVVEDCSQSHGARIGGQLVGTFGDIAAFSTMFRKAHITGGSGGVVYTRDQDLYHWTLAYSDRGKPRWRDDYDGRNPNQFLCAALNLHADEISCAIGEASLKRLDTTIAKRLAFVAEMVGRLADRSKLCHAQYAPGDSPFVLPIIMDRPAEEFAKAVRAKGVPLNPKYQYLVCDWPWVKPYIGEVDTLNARDIRDRSFMLYLNENYGIEEAAAIVNAICEVERETGVR